jgi:hypothetical protein
MTYTAADISIMCDSPQPAVIAFIRRHNYPYTMELREVRYKGRGKKDIPVQCYSREVLEAFKKRKKGNGKGNVFAHEFSPMMSLFLSTLAENHRRMKRRDPSARADVGGFVDEFRKCVMEGKVAY